MRLTSLAVENFRNLKKQDVQFDNTFILFIGPNGQGKTNVLESIYTLALTKSHRTTHDRDMIAWEHDWCSARGVSETNLGSHQLECIISQKHKIVKINDLPVSKLSHYIGTLKIVVFSPEQLQLVKGSPSIRRKFLDREISQIYPSYLKELYNYHQVLLQRNHCLKNIQQKNTKDESVLDVWNEQFIYYGSKIISKRIIFLQSLEKWAQTIHESIAGCHERLSLRYVSNMISPEQITDERIISEQFMIKLKERFVQERMRGITLIGPHRDDIQFFLNDREAYAFGSQGQQRTTALSIKLAEVCFIKELTGEYPILLLDDVLSELDAIRQNRLAITFQDQVQTFITSTNGEALSATLRKQMKTFHVEQGILSVE